MKPALLDVNVLLALGWQAHQHHAKANAWFLREASNGWATCPETQTGFIRLSSNPSFTKECLLPEHAALLLQKMEKHEDHRFWVGINASTPAHYTKALVYRQVSDAYLVMLARHHGGRLVTFDTGAQQHAREPEDVTVLR